MISAWDIEHGDISKGALASDLKFFGSMASPKMMTSQKHIGQLRNLKTAVKTKVKVKR